MTTFNSDSNLHAMYGFVHWKWRPAQPKVTEQPAEVTDDRGRSRPYFSLRPKLRENTGKGQWGWLFQANIFKVGANPSDATPPDAAQGVGAEQRSRWPIPVGS